MLRKADKEEKKASIKLDEFKELLNIRINKSEDECFWGNSYRHSKAVPPPSKRVTPFGTAKLPTSLKEGGSYHRF